MKYLLVILIANIVLFANTYKEAMALYDKEQYTKALKILRELSDQGDPKAQNDVGIMYEMGQGTRGNFKIAETYYEKSAAQGYADGQCNLGQVRKAQKKYREAVKLFQLSANQGNACGENFLGIMYQYAKGVGRNYNKAIKYYTRSAEKGHYLAQSNLAFMYEKGRGVRRDYEKAAYWYNKSAKQDYFVAQYNLGVLYMVGKGIPQDLEKAKELFKKACDNGHLDGCTDYKKLTQ
jgi:uncharacterized protein